MEVDPLRASVAGTGTRAGTSVAGTGTSASVAGTGTSVAGTGTRAGTSASVAGTITGTGTSVAGTITGTGTSVADIRSKYIVILIDIITIYNIQFLRDRNSFHRVAFNLLFNRFIVNFNAFK